MLPNMYLKMIGFKSYCQKWVSQWEEVTATGLLLLRVVDPNCKTKAASAFASKLLLHEPFMGGGLWTGMAIPMLVIYGGWHVLIITSIAIAIWSLYLFLALEISLLV